ncbi:MAG TPA: hypothetical protein K8W19_09780 [Victivallis vadensis]|nr:hypothetical protein [Victivallis vadensis]
MKMVQPEKLKKARAVVQKLLTRNRFIQIVAEGKTARIRTDENSFISVMMKRDVIVPVLLDAGFDHVALDLEGVPAVRRGN